MSRSGRSWGADGAPPSGREGWWDSRARIVVLGGLLPGLLFLWAVADLVRGAVWLPGRGPGWHAFTADREPLVFLGVILIKLAAATIACAEWGFGNHPTVGWYSHLIAFVAAVVAAAGVLLAFVGAAM